MHKARLLFLIILIEGYIVLACEIIAIRQLIPFVGSGVEIVSIIISGVLLPLAAGYHVGGTAYRRTYRIRRSATSIRKILLRNMLGALLFLTLGLSYTILERWFPALNNMGIMNRLAQTALYTVIFLVIPVFLLGQTVPLISHYLAKRKINEATGKMLFFSTAGSFLGSVFSTLVLMNTIGVHNTVIITLGLLALLGMLLSRENMIRIAFLCLFIAGVGLNNDTAMQSARVVSDNAYNLVQLGKINSNLRFLSINHSLSAILDNKNRRIGYIKYTEKRFIVPISDNLHLPKDILIIGAGGFALGLEDTVNRYTYVDIDGTIKDVVEKYFLQRSILPNKRFVASSARAYVHNTDKKYDLIFIDAFTNRESIPMECITRNFLLDVKSRLKENGIVIVNVIASANFGDTFSVRYDNTFSSVFPVHSRQIIQLFNGWEDDDVTETNVMYIYYNKHLAQDRTVYTDDRNTYSFDRK